MPRSLFRSASASGASRISPRFSRVWKRGRQHGEKDFGLSLVWIFDTIRQFGAEKAQKVLDLAIQFHDRNVVAFGIGGDESAGPPEWFAEVYARAAERGLHLTAHAGESAGPSRFGAR